MELGRPPPPGYGKFHTFFKKFLKPSLWSLFLNKRVGLYWVELLFQLQQRWYINYETRLELSFSVLNMNGTGYISQSNGSDFSFAAKLFSLLLVIPCLATNLTILMKLLLKPHLWSILNAFLSLLLSKSTSAKRWDISHIHIWIFQSQIQFMGLYNFQFLFFVVLIK